MLDYLEGYKFKKSEFESIDLREEKIIFGRLKALEEMALFIENMRLSLTRLLVVNQVDATTDEELMERWDKKDEEEKECTECKELNKNISDIEEE
jgi:hypothetical protein